MPSKRVQSDKKPILAFVLESLEGCRGQWQEVSDATGVKYTTLTKIAQRRIPNPGVNSIQRLADYFRARETA